MHFNGGALAYDDVVHQDFTPLERIRQVSCPFELLRFCLIFALVYDDVVLQGFTPLERIRQVSCPFELLRFCLIFTSF